MREGVKILLSIVVLPIVLGAVAGSCISTPGCVSGRQASPDVAPQVQVATSQPVRVEQDTAAVMLKLDELLKVNLELKAKVTGIEAKYESTRIYGQDPKTIAMSFAALVAIVVWFTRRRGRRQFQQREDKTWVSAET
jgi:outer membrane murein-binding lipoprotein Lpp